MENILIDTDVVIEYLRSKDKSTTESNYHPQRRWLVFVGPGRYADLSA